jgi:hypothetical protein
MICCCLLAGCPPAPQGYVLRADTDWLIGFFSSLTVLQTSPSTVGPQCSSTPNCLAYNIRGSMLIGRPGTPVTYLPFRGFCTYVKDPTFKPAAPPPSEQTSSVIGMFFLIMINGGLVLSFMFAIYSPVWLVSWAICSVSCVCLFYPELILLIVPTCINISTHLHANSLFNWLGRSVLLAARRILPCFHCS